MPNNVIKNGKVPNRILNTTIFKLLFDFLKMKNPNRVFSSFSKEDGTEFVDYVLNEFKVEYQVSPEDIKRIPKTKPFIVISNYPLGGIEIFITIKVFTQIHPDFKVVVNKYFNDIIPLCKHSHTLSGRMKRKISAKNISLLENLLQKEKTNGALAIFPASLVRSFQSPIYTNVDKAWDMSLIKAIRKSQIAILPVYFKGNKSWLAKLLANFPNLFNSTRQKPTEFITKVKIVMRIGNLISPEKQSEYSNYHLFRRYLRSRIYALGTGLDARRFRLSVVKLKTKRAENIIDAVPNELLIKEMNAIVGQYLLFESGDFQVVCVPSLDIPNILREIGRLREITFREVGEGSNKSIDLDDYDLYYQQLIVWDKVNKKIAGAYRAGMGKEIIEQFGIEGFYINSLFKIKKTAKSILSQSIELGRSFIVKEYQRKPMSLFLLWKGILYFLLKHEEYRYLIGPASISNDFSKISKNLIVSFFQNNHYDHELAEYFKPRKQFRITRIKNIDQKLFFETEKDIKNVDKFIVEIENAQGIPVLFKKYIKLNAKVVGFNVDPSFNNCLDGLIVLDVFNVPQETLKSLSKEINDTSILKRFKLI